MHNACNSEILSPQPEKKMCGILALLVHLHPSHPPAVPMVRIAAWCESEQHVNWRLSGSRE